MIYNVQTAPLQGQFVTWSGNNLAEVKELAGTTYVGMEGGMIFLLIGRQHHTLNPGWGLARFGEKVLVMSDIAQDCLLTVL